MVMDEHYLRMIHVFADLHGKVCIWYLLEEALVGTCRRRAVRIDADAVHDQTLELRWLAADSSPCIMYGERLL